MQKISCFQIRLREKSIERSRDEKYWGWNTYEGLGEYRGTSGRGKGVKLPKGKGRRWKLEEKTRGWEGEKDR